MALMDKRVLNKKTNSPRQGSGWLVLKFCFSNTQHSLACESLAMRTCVLHGAEIIPSIEQFVFPKIYVPFSPPPALPSLPNLGT